MGKRFRIAPQAILMSLLAFALLSLSASSPRSQDAGDDGPRFGPWSGPVNLGSVVNSSFGETGAAISKDGLSLFFTSNRLGSLGRADIWVSQRQSLDAPWETPQNLGPPINTGSDENAPALTVDGHCMFFHSDRPEGLGGSDMYVSCRSNKRDNFGWQTPVNLGSGVNTTANETQPAYFEDDETGVVTLYFASNRNGGVDPEDIYASTLQSDGTFGPAVEVAELNSSKTEFGPTIRRDGLEIIWGTFRPVSADIDLWFSTRASTRDSWSTPMNLGPIVNSTGPDNRPSLSFDGTELYFQSTRTGGFGAQDLYVSTRAKLKGPE